MNKYTFGKCLRCGKITALNNGYCANCSKALEGDEFIKFFTDTINKKD